MSWKGDNVYFLPLILRVSLVKGTRCPQRVHVVHGTAAQVQR